jgi:hypothetical protein
MLVASATMPKKNVPGPSVLTSINFPAVDEPGRTLQTNGELALPTISTPPGATVKLSGCDFASAIRSSAANVACAKVKMRTAQDARYQLRLIHMVESLEGRFWRHSSQSIRAECRIQVI